MTSHQEILCQAAQSVLRETWPQWNVEELIGKGSYGEVYRIRKEEMGIVTKCALKLIRIGLETDGTITLLHDHFADAPGGSSSAYARAVQNVTHEIRIMERLKGAPNIVVIEDYTTLQRGSELTILIRMELLKGIPALQKDGGLAGTSETVRLGLDMCRALSFCEKSSIIHRDIKPGNIFVDSRGSFKLGDFGIARHMENFWNAASMTSTGTISYMAPEIYQGKKYDHTADIYSLGLVLYQILNRGAMPFMPAQGWTNSQLQESNFRRMVRGEALPCPVNADRALGAVICKACSYNPRDRFQNASAFAAALRDPNGFIKSEHPVTPHTGFTDRLLRLLRRLLHGGRRLWLTCGLLIMGVVFACSMLWYILHSNEDKEAEKSEPGGETSQTYIADNSPDENDSDLPETQQQTPSSFEEEDQRAQAESEQNANNTRHTYAGEDNYSNGGVLADYSKSNSEDTDSEETETEARDSLPQTGIAKYSIRCVDAAGNLIYHEDRQKAIEVDSSGSGEQIIVYSPDVDGYTAREEMTTVDLLIGETSLVRFVYDKEEPESFANIPDDALQYNGHSYYAYVSYSESEVSSYLDAVAIAESMGGYLAVIDDSSENRVLHDYIINDLGYESAYFGYTDDGSEGRWYWVGDHSSNFESWASGKPDNKHGNEDYALFWYGDSNYKWNDGDFGRASKDNSLIFLIEWDTTK